MKKSTLFAFTLVSMFVCALTANAQWQQSATNLGSPLNCFAVKGTITFAGTSDSGVFKSTNDTTWTASNSGLTTLDVNTILVSGSKVFAGTWGGGIFVSANSGINWTQVVDSGLTASYISSMAVNGSYIYAATADEGMFLSPDNGVTWMAINNGFVTDYFVSAFVSGTKAFAGSYYGGVFASPDSGKLWDATGLTSSKISSFAVSGSNLYGASQVEGVFFSQDNGQTWALRDTGLTDNAIFSLAASGSNVLAGSNGAGVFLSQNAAKTWAPFNTGGLAGLEIYAMTVSPSYIFAGTNSGHVWRRSLSDLTSCVPIVTASDHAICQGSYATLTVTSGSAYLWNTGDTTQSIIVNTAGIYSCAVNTNCGILTSNSDTLVVKPLPVATISASGPTTFCQGSSGNVTLTASSGVSYLWSNGNTTATLKNLSTSQTDSVTVVGANGCKATSSPVSVISIPYPPISSQPKNDTVYASCTSAQFYVGDTIGSPTYQWQANVGFGFGNISNTGNYSGVTTNTLTISNASQIMNGYSYRCVLSNSICSSTSAAALLIIKAAKVVSKTVTLCAGDSLSVGIHTYDSTGVYIDTLHAVNGCDSMYITTHLAIDSIIKFTQSIFLCKGDSIIIGGIYTHDTTGTFIDTLQAGLGCDSIVTTKLTVRAAIKDSVSITLCSGDSLTVGIHTYSATGVYKDSLTTLIGCDSIVTTNLVISSKVKFAQTMTLCAGESVTVGGIYTHDTTGTFTDTLQAGLGCDSIVTTNLTIKPAAKFAQTDTLCSGDSLAVGMYIHNTSGTYIDTLTTLAGCDSIVTTHLVFNSTIKFTQTISLCKGDSIIVGGIFTHDTAGTFTDALQAGLGCDSIVTTILTITTDSSSQTPVLCVGDSITVGIHSYKTSGTYYDTFITVSGCDSIVTTKLIFAGDVVLHGDTLTAQATPAAYEWFNCDNMDSILAFTKSFYPGVDGDYAAIVTLTNGCTDTSACFTISNVGIAGNNLSYSVVVYPNPATNRLTIHTSAPLSNNTVMVSVMNVVGEVMQKEILKWTNYINLDINNLPAGMYFIQIKSESGDVTRKFVKQ